MRRFGLVILLPITVLAGVYFAKIAVRNYSQNPSIPKLTANSTLHNYDIIFQTSLSAQSKAIQLATHSPYSHCGIIYFQGNNCMVWEACNGVTVTPLAQFIRRGKGQHAVIKRLQQNAAIAQLNADSNKFNAAFRQYLHRPYDLYFGWGDDKLYCSELVWKIYQRATGIELGPLHQLHDFDLSNPVVLKKMQQRYGNNIPWHEPVISPANIFNSPKLKTVMSI